MLVSMSVGTPKKRQLNWSLVLGIGWIVGPAVLAYFQRRFRGDARGAPSYSCNKMTLAKVARILHVLWDHISRAFNVCFFILWLFDPAIFARGIFKSCWKYNTWKIQVEIKWEPSPSSLMFGGQDMNHFSKMESGDFLQKHFKKIHHQPTNQPTNQPALVWHSPPPGSSLKLPDRNMGRGWAEDLGRESLEMDMWRHSPGGSE